MNLNKAECNAGGRFGNWRNKMKAQDLCSWPGANRSDSRSYREDEQQRQGRKDQLSCFANCQTAHL